MEDMNQFIPHGYDDGDFKMTNGGLCWFHNQI